MFGNFVQKLQSLSPLTSPTTSPTVSPRPKRKFFGRAANRKRRVGGYAKEDLREVQSEPELDYENPGKSKQSRFFGLTSEKRKYSAPPVPENSAGGNSSAPFHKSNGHIGPPNGSASHQSSSTTNPSNGCYASAYSVVSRAGTSSDSRDLNGHSIYEDVFPLKGPHVSVYNISSPTNPSKSNVINVNIKNDNTSNNNNPSYSGSKSNSNAKGRSESNAHISKVNVPEYNSISRAGAVNINVSNKKSENVSTVDIHESYKTLDSRKISSSHEQQPMSLPNHVRMGQTVSSSQLEARHPNSNGLSSNNHSNGLKIHHPLQSSQDVRKLSLSLVNNNNNNNHHRRVGSTVQPNQNFLTPRKPAPLPTAESRKTSYEPPRKNAPPTYHRTLSSDYYQSGGGLYSCLSSRVDEPYPLPPSPHEDDIYDVPSRIARKVESSKNRDSRPGHISRTVGKMEGLRQAERVSEYEQFFASLVVDTHPDHPDRPPLYRHHQTASNLVCARDATGGDGELERIQELFPHDSLRLHDPHHTTQKMKGLIRKRSTTAARLQRAFSANKGNRGQGHPDQPPPLQHVNGYTNGSSLQTTTDFNTSYNANNSVNSSTNTGYHDASTDCMSPGLNSTTASTNGSTPYSNRQQNYHQDPSTPSAPRPKRHFIMETPVQFTTGVSSQERHLFLFSDLLLVAKSRSGGNFKLKEKVRVSEMWLASCLEDVAEVSKSHDTSFVMGWPTTNVVATFSCVQTKDLWYNKLAQVIAEEKEGSPPTNIQVSYTDPRTSVEICKTVSITANTNARECITLILDHLEMRDVDVTKFQLWVKSSQEESPYPLIGHEFPLSIKYNGMRESNLDCNSEHFNNLYNNCNDIKFTLRAHGKVGSNGSSPENGKKVSKKARKSPIRNKLFKKSANKGDTVDGSSAAPAGILFGHPLYKLVEVNNGALPKPVLDMLTQLFQKGPFTEGIFRKSANARVVREMRDKLDSGCPSDLSEANITAVAALFKDFLRSLPDALLNCQLHDDWLDVPRLPSIRDQISRTLLLCSRLPRSNLLLLQHFLCVLHHITRRSKTNKMSASNLAVCVGPSVLWSSPPVLSFSAETTKQHSSIVEFLIDRFGDIFGEAMLRLMGDPPEHDPSAARQDSGAEETDSMHSCNGRRDDSSIDSLERDLEGLSPLPRKDKMSLTNLSRDSGLTMSDTQLYTPDEEESESTSSGHSSGDKSMPYNEHRPVERVSHYPAPNNPHAIYTAVCRRPEKQIAYDEQENYYATPSREHTRVQITYSSPCNQTGMMDVAGHGYNQERLMDSQRTMCESEGIYSVPNTEHQLHLQEQLQEMEKMNSNFQRDDWMRRKSNLRKVSKTNSNEGGCLTRSTSEESLLSKCNSHEYGLSLSAGGPPPLTLPCEDRSRSPPSIEYDDNVGFMSRDSAIRRSRSAHYLAEVRREKLKDKSDEPSTIVRSSSQDTFSFLRSRSTPHIQDEGDRSYDSSTLSDDDSTPHVSRSNSRGKECGSTGAPSWDATLTPSDSGNSRNSSFKSERTGSVCTVVSAGSCSTLASNPPSYEEALNRRSIMQQQQFTEYAIREEKLKSARAKKLYAESVKQYQDIAFSAGDIVRASPAHIHDGDDIDSPPPLPPKGDPPPLPPKQRASRRGQNDSSSRLKHHPPVHVETQSRKQKLSNTPSPQSSGFGQTMHKTIIYTDVGPPNLPPKERTVIEVVESTSESDRVRQQTVRTVSPRQGVEKKSIETQTDDCDLGDSDDLRDEDSQTSDSWLSDHITSVHVPDSSFNYSTGQNRNTVSSGNNTSINNSNSNNNQNRSRGRPRRRDSSTSQRSRSVPSRDSVTGMHSASDSEDDEWEYPSPSHEYHSSSAAINYGLRDFRNLEADHRPELTWSVSQLRERFGESHRGAKVHPPPYRPPPNRAPITSYHLGAGDTFCRKTPSRPQSTYGEESYV